MTRTGTGTLAQNYATTLCIYCVNLHGTTGLIMKLRLGLIMKLRLGLIMKLHERSTPFSIALGCQVVYWEESECSKAALLPYPGPCCSSIRIVPARRLRCRSSLLPSTHHLILLPAHAPTLPLCLLSNPIQSCPPSLTLISPATQKGFKRAVTKDTSHPHPLRSIYGSNDPGVCF